MPAVPAMLAVPCCSISSSCLPYVHADLRALQLVVFTAHVHATMLLLSYAAILLLSQEWVNHAVAGRKHGQPAHWLPWYDRSHLLLHM